MFVGLYAWSFVHFVSESYSSYGFDHQPVPDFYLALAWILAILPAYGCRSVAAGFAAGILGPISHGRHSFDLHPAVRGLNKPGEIVPLMLTMCAGPAVLGAGCLSTSPVPGSENIPESVLDGVRRSRPDDHAGDPCFLLGQYAPGFV